MGDQALSEVTDESIRCMFFDPKDELSCPFRTIDPRVYSYSGQNYCATHLPTRPDDKCKVTELAIADLERIATRTIASQVQGLGKIDIRSAHFVSNPFRHIQRGPTTDVTISDSCFYENVDTSGFNYSFSRLSLSNCDIVGHFDLAQSTRIEGDLDLSGLSTTEDLRLNCALQGRVEASNINCGGSLRLIPVTCNSTVEVDLSGCVVSGDVQIAGKTHFQSLNLESMHCGGSADVRLILPNTKLDMSKFRAKRNVHILGNATSLSGGWTSNDTGGEPVSGHVTLEGKFSEVSLTGFICNSLKARNTQLGRVLFFGVEILGMTDIQGSTATVLEFNSGGSLNGLYAPGCSFDFVRLKDWSAKHIEFGASAIGEISVDDCTVNQLLSLAIPPGEQGEAIKKCYIDGGSIHLLDCNNRTFSSVIAISSTEFGSAPNFINCQFAGAAEFPLSIDSYPCDTKIAASSYRELKKIMEDKRHRQAQGLFHALEQRSTRLRYSESSFERTVSYLYDLSSQYGYSTGRPLAWLAGVFICSVLLYWIGRADSYFDWSATIDTDALRAAFMDGVRQVIAPFYDVRTEKNVSYIIVLKVVHSLISVTLIALSVLAIRWKFRRG